MSPDPDRASVFASLPIGADRDSAVEVLHDGRWLPGTLLHAYRRREDGRWRGIVRYTADVGEQYEQSRDQDEIRPASAAPPWPLT